MCIYVCLYRPFIKTGCIVVAEGGVNVALAHISLNLSIYSFPLFSEAYIAQ